MKSSHCYVRDFLIQGHFIAIFQFLVTLLTANLSHIQQQTPSTTRTEMETKLKQEKDEMDRQLLNSAQQILQQRLVCFILYILL